MYWPRGRGWGGSSSINAMVYIRGHAADYDQWAQAGNAGWSFAEVLPYFKRAESLEGDGDEGYHGYDGPLSVAKSDRRDDILLDRFIEAGQQAGFALTDDFNGRQQEGFSRYELDLAIQCIPGRLLARWPISISTTSTREHAALPTGQGALGSFPKHVGGAG